MQTIYKIFATSLFLLFLSCGNSSNPLADKKAELEALKSQQQKLNDDISKLEGEIAKLDPSTVEEKSKLVSLTEISKDSFSHYIELQGTVESENISYVAPRNGQGGVVKAIYVNKGDYVKKGQLLLKLDDAIYHKNMAQIKTQLAFAEDLLRRQTNLWNQQIGTELQVVQAKNNVDQIKNQMAVAQEQLDMTRIYADVSGVADQVNVRVGEFFTGTAGLTPQIRIVNNNNLKITTQVPENYMQNVSVGTKVIISLPDIGKSFNSSISVAGKLIDPNTRAFYVEAKLPTDKDLRPNQIALVKILDYFNPAAITAPLNTIQTDEEGKFIMVAVNENGKLIAKKKHVIIGQLNENRIEVKSGLQPGDKVINEGFQSVYEGQLLTTQSI